MNPYEVLGLTEGESDERTIKRAYAKLLKQHRPDEDPDGFTRVHRAYVSLTGNAVDTRVLVTPSKERIESSRPPLPNPTDETWESECRTLAAMRDAEPGADRELGLSRAITRLSGMLAEGRGDWSRAAQLVVPVVAEQTRRWGDAPDSMIVRLLEENPELIEERLLFLLKGNQQQQVLGLLRAWVDDLECRHSSTNAERTVLLRVMSWCVFLDFRSAARIAALFPRFYGRQSLAQCDLALTAGHGAKNFPVELPPLLAQIIAGTERTRSPAVRGLVAYVKALGVEHPVRRLLVLRAPSLMGGRGKAGGQTEDDGNRTVMIGVFVSLALAGGYLASQALFGRFSLFVISGPIFAVWLIMVLFKRFRR